MARVGRFHGALLAESEGGFFLVGDLKEPADFAAGGFLDPGELQPLQNPFVRLSVSGSPEIVPPYLTTNVEGTELAGRLFHRLVIKRNGSVSERLWNLIFDAREYDGQKIIDADWLLEIPDEIWEIVREQVLRCR
jgi:hypothetical protein